MKSDSPTEHFLTLACKRKDRPNCVQELFHAILDAGLQVLVVITRPTLGTRLKAARLRMPKGRGFRIFPVSDVAGIDDAVSLLVDMPLWHKPVFHILIGGHKFTTHVVDKCAGNPRLHLVDFEKEIQPYVLGYLDPVDDELECYGEKRFVGALSSLSTWTVTTSSPDGSSRSKRNPVDSQKDAHLKPETIDS